MPEIGPVVRSVALPAVSSGTIGPQNVNHSFKYLGFSVRETSGSAAAIIRIREGGAVTGTVVDVIALAAGEAVADEYVHGRTVEGGFYIQLVSGTMPEGAVFYA